MKARKWLTEHGFSEIHSFPHTRFSKDLNFKGLKFDGIAINDSKICLFQVKSNRRPSKAYLKQMGEFAIKYGVDVLWFNVRDRKDMECLR